MRDTVLDVLKVLLGIAIPLASFVTGLRATSANPQWLVRRPWLLMRSLLVILVIVPVGAILFLQTLAIDAVVRAGITVAVVAIGIGPPAAFKQFKPTDGREDVISYEIALNVLLLTLAIVYIPAVVAIHGAVFHHHLELAPGPVAKVVLGKALIPLFLGVIVGRLSPRVIGPMNRYAGIFIQAVLLVVVLVALVGKWRDLVGLGGRAWLACAAIVVGEIVIGHLAGGPSMETRRVLASFSAFRFPALALLLAAVIPRGHELVPAILAYVIVSLVLVGVHSALTSMGERRGAAGHSGHAGRPAPLKGAPGRAGL